MDWWYVLFSAWSIHSHFLVTLTRFHEPSRASRVKLNWRSNEMRMIAVKSQAQNSKSDYGKCVFRNVPFIIMLYIMRHDLLICILPLLPCHIHSSQYFLLPEDTTFNRPTIASAHLSLHFHSSLCLRSSLAFSSSKT